MKINALIVAGGSSLRFGDDLPKQFQLVNSKPLLSWTIEKFEQSEMIDEIILVVSEEYMLYTSDQVIDPFHYDKVRKMVSGGESRRESVLNGLKAMSDRTDFVAIHDAARPLVTSSDINRTIEAAKEYKGAILAKQVTDTIKQADDKFIGKTLDRSILYQAQTPQIFDYQMIYDAHIKFDHNPSGEITDDASLFELSGHKVVLVENSSPNFKITTKHDMKLAELYLKDKSDE